MATKKILTPETRTVIKTEEGQKTVTTMNNGATVTNITPEIKENTTKATKVMLSFKEKYELGKLVEAEYKTSKMNDTKFAEYASEKIGKSVTPAAVKRTREDLGIPSNRGSINSSETGLQLANLQEHVVALENYCNLLEDHIKENIGLIDLFYQRPTMEEEKEETFTVAG